MLSKCNRSRRKADSHPCVLPCSSKKASRNLHASSPSSCCSASAKALRRRSRPEYDEHKLASVPLPEHKLASVSLPEPELGSAPDRESELPPRPKLSELAPRPCLCASSDTRLPALPKINALNASPIACCHDPISTGKMTIPQGKCLSPKRLQPRLCFNRSA